jgi:hypothetical protein
VWVQRSGDGCGARVQLDADQLPGGVGGEAEEGARSAARFQHPPGGVAEAVLAQCVPQCADQGCVGVVGVQRGAGRGLVLGFGQQLSQLGALLCELVATGIEDRGGRAPPGPVREHRLLLDRGWAVLGLDGAQYPQRGEVGRHLGLRPGRGQIRLRDRAKPGWC